MRRTALRAARANHVFRSDEKRIRTENMVTDKSKDSAGVLSKIADCARMAFSSVRKRRSARTVFRPRRFCQNLRAARANHVFRADEKRIRTENMVMDKSKDSAGVSYKIVDCARMAFSSVRKRRSARTVFRPRRFCQNLRAARANHVFRADEKRIRTENMVMDKSKDSAGVSYKIVASARMCFSSVRNRRSARTGFRPRQVSCAKYPCRAVQPRSMVSAAPVIRPVAAVILSLKPLSRDFQLSGTSTLFLNASRRLRRLNQASTLGRGARSMSMPNQRQLIAPSGISPMVSALPAM